MRYSGEHKAQTRARVLEVASRAIRANGVNRVSVKSIMDRAGLTHGGFYAHFTSKDDLVAHAIAHMFAERYERSFKEIDGGEAGHILAALIDAYLSMSHRNAVEYGCPLPALATEIPQLATGACGALDAGSRQLQAALETLLARLGRPDPAGLAAFVLAQAIGAIVLARVAIDAVEAERILGVTREGLRRFLNLGGSAG